MKIAIMQPYFLPYIGYFQLINAVDTFVLYDNIQYTKKGWINRNRILVNGKDEYITLPLKKDSDYLNINQRFLAETSRNDFQKIINKCAQVYKKAPHYSEGMDLLKNILNHEASNLFEFLYNSIVLTMDYLNINTPIIKSSTLPINNELKSQEKVIDICKTVNAEIYINPIGGVKLYSEQHFMDQGIELQFLKTSEFSYPQFMHAFVPLLSIIDVIMFNHTTNIYQFLNNEFKLLNHE
jgi:hypothetical protein